MLLSSPTWLCPNCAYVALYLTWPWPSAYQGAHGNFARFCLCRIRISSSTIDRLLYFQEQHKRMLHVWFPLKKLKKNFNFIHVLIFILYLKQSELADNRKRRPCWLWRHDSYQWTLIYIYVTGSMRNQLVCKLPREFANSMNDQVVCKLPS